MIEEPVAEIDLVERLVADEPGEVRSIGVPSAAGRTPEPRQLFAAGRAGRVSGCRRGPCRFCDGRGNLA